MPIIMFSGKFPKDHPKHGEPTLFVEKILSGKKLHTIRAGNRWKEGMKFSPRFWSDIPYKSKQFKFAPDIEIKKVWNIEIKTIESLYSNPLRKIFRMVVFINGRMLDIDEEKSSRDNFKTPDFRLLAKNDGLEQEDFVNWFHPNPYKDGKFIHMKPFKGQIICWDNKIIY